MTTEEILLAFLEWQGHKDNCSINVYQGFDILCDCGFSALIERLKEGIPK